MPGSTVQSGVRRQSVYFVREVAGSDGEPTTPSDPTFKLYSSVINSVETDTGLNFENRVGLGNTIGQGKSRQQEDHEITINYDLERFPTDSGGNANDAFYDVSKRNEDNQPENTHSFLLVEKHNSLATENTVHYRYFTEQGNTHPNTGPSAANLDTRYEVYGEGGIPEEATLSLDPGDSASIEAEVTYIVYKRRDYQIDQPDGSKTIYLKSTASGDTGLDVELETIDGSTSETLSTDGTDGTTVVSSTESYDSLRVAVPGAQQGDIEVYQDGGSGSAGELLTVIRGQDARDGVEADDGVPLVGGGSFETVSGVAALGDAIPAGAASSITFDGHDAAEQIASTELTISNEVEDVTTGEGLTKAIYAGQREISVEASVFGETESAQNFGDMLRGAEGLFEIPTAEGDIRVERAYIEDGGSQERESGNAVMQTDVTWMGLEPSGSTDALVYNNT